MPFAKKLLPVAKKYLLPHAKTAAVGIADDLFAGKNFHTSIKEHGKKAINSAVHSAFDQSGSGTRSKRKLSNKNLPKSKRIKLTSLAIKTKCHQKPQSLSL